MTEYLIIALLLMDAVILYVVFFLNKRWKTHDDILSDITEERQIISDFHSKIKNEVGHAKEDNKKILKEVNRVAAQIEQDIQSSSSNLSKNLDELIQEASKKFDLPLQELARKQQSLESLYRRIELERERLTKVVNRGEKIGKLLSQEVPAEEILKDIQQKKYIDARALLTKGVPIDQIAKELGMNPSEIRLLEKINS